MPYDYARELEKAEIRINKDIDRRFAEYGDDIKKLEDKIDSFSIKLDNIIKENNDNTKFSLRFIISVIVSFILGGGALGFIQFIQGVTHRP